MQIRPKLYDFSCIESKKDFSCRTLERNEILEEYISESFNPLLSSLNELSESLNNTIKKERLSKETVFISGK